MIRVIDHIDEIVDTCFDQELRDLLEFTVNSTKVTVKDQFLFHYESACYEGTKESMIRGIMYKIHLQEDLVLKLKDYKINLSKILNLGEYSKVRLSYKEELGTETAIGASGSNTDNKNAQTDNYSGIDHNHNINVNDNRTAASQTNKVEELKAYIPQSKIMRDEDPLGIKKFQLEDDRPIETPTNYTGFKLDNPQIQEEGELTGYQNLSKDLTSNETRDTNTTNSSRGGESTGESKTRSASTRVTGNKNDATETTSEFITNDARIKLWTKELPRLKVKF